MRLSSREQVLFEVRKHGIVLAGSLAKSLLLALAGTALVAAGWPWSGAGVLVMAVAALVALRAVWRWDRTKLVVTNEQLCLAFGVLRRRTASVRLSKLGAVELEQTLPGRLLGYGTLIAGGLEVDYLPAPAELHELVGGLVAVKGR